MNHLKIIKKVVLFFLIILCLIPSMSFIAVDAAGTIYETELNNTAATANRTYDDYDNYGKISTTGDVDWWVVTFSSTGMANFWLGNIPAGCDYDLYVYDNNGINILAYSNQGSNSDETIRCRVNWQNTYRVKIVSYSGSSNSYYKFRVKNYSIGDAKIFTVDYDVVGRTLAAQSLSHIWSMGYGGQEFLNNSVGPAYNVLPSTRIFVAYNHGTEGGMSFHNNTWLWGNSYTGMPSSDRAISSYASNALSEVRLAIFAGCRTGVTSNPEGNLVGMALNKGATCSIGWSVTLWNDGIEAWVPQFFNACKSNKSIANALDTADYWIQQNMNQRYTELRNRYIGSSRIRATLI